jgi:hypothetical protein
MSNQQAAFSLLKILYRSETLTLEASINLRGIEDTSKDDYLFASLQRIFNAELEGYKAEHTTTTAVFNNLLAIDELPDERGSVSSKEPFQFAPIYYALTGKYPVRRNFHAAPSVYSLTTANQSDDDQTPEENKPTEINLPCVPELNYDVEYIKRERELINAWLIDQKTENPKPDSISGSVTAVAALTNSGSSALFGGRTASEHAHKTQPNKNQKLAENDNSANQTLPHALI